MGLRRKSNWCCTFFKGLYCFHQCCSSNPGTPGKCVFYQLCTVSTSITEIIRKPVTITTSCPSTWIHISFYVFLLKWMQLTAWFWKLFAPGHIFAICLFSESKWTGKVTETTKNNLRYSIPFYNTWRISNNRNKKSVNCELE